MSGTDHTKRKPELWETLHQYTVVINDDIIIKKVWANNICDAYSQALLKVEELRELPFNQINYTTEQTK